MHAWRVAPRPVPAPVPGKVLVAGIYMAGRRHHATHLVRRYQSSRFFDVTQAWIALGGEPDSARLAAVTVERVSDRVPKFSLLNKLLARYELSEFDYIIVTDDDVTVPHGFLDSFLAHQQKYDLALAQPARTPWSQTDHGFVLRSRDTAVRRTRFVEIGPVFSIRREMVPLLMPFDESSPMGWGYDMVWPCIAEKAGLRIGIVDATPVDHTLRPQGVTYSKTAEMDVMRAYLDRNRHLTPAEAEVVLEAYP